MALAVVETIIMPAHDPSVTSVPIVSNIVPAVAKDTIAKNAEVEINYDHGRPSSSGFTAWSSPGLKGHKQRTKNTPGCYKLNSGAVGGFEGDSNTQYAFYGDLRCSQNILLASSTAPVRCIDPVIYSRSVKMFKSSDDDDTPKQPDPNRYSLVT
ncbi:hypothetical protein BGZ47_009915 [Haplosporangium gracile]|nr:hypothetical protein BGZ47_009915 [Haplosporangium gracile]